MVTLETKEMNEIFHSFHVEDNIFKYKNFRDSRNKPLRFDPQHTFR